MPDEEISRRTLAHYDSRAEDFWQGTRDHDVSQNVAALLRHIEGATPAPLPPYTILDFGCGPGRDLKAFTGLGHIAVGLEGSARFAACRANSTLVGERLASAIIGIWKKQNQRGR